MGYSIGGVENQPNRTDISDEECEAFIAAHPSGATCEEIAEVLGCTRTRVGQILNKALKKAVGNAIRRGISLADLPPHRETIWDRLGSS